MPANHLDLFAGMLTGQLLGASASPSARSCTGFTPAGADVVREWFAHAVRSYSCLGTPGGNPQAWE
jgi:hypothetical protein